MTSGGYHTLYMPDNPKREAYRAEHESTTFRKIDCDGLTELK